MTAMRRHWAPVLAVVVALAIPVAAGADQPHVLTVLAVKVKGDQDAYLEKVKKFIASAKRLDAGGTTRVWRASLAGTDSGLIFIASEFPNLEAFAKGNAKVQADEELKKLRKEINASGVREVVSSSLFEEVTP